MNIYGKRTFIGQTFAFFLRRSTYVHLALLSLSLIGGKVISDQQDKLREKNMELVMSSVRVDMVAMPTYTLNELKNLSSGVEEAKKEELTPEPEAQKVEPKEVTEVPPKEEEKSPEKETTPSFEEENKLKRQNFLSKLKQIGNKKINSDGNQKAEKGLYGENNSDLKQLVLSGNKLSKGTQLYGNGNSGDMTAFQAYATRLPDLVRPHWRLPSFLLEKKLKCRVRVWLAPNGEVTRAEIYQSSGDTEYDQRAIDAVKATSPFPRLSEDYAKRGQSGDILLGFPL